MYIFEWMIHFIKGKKYRPFIKPDFIPEDGEGLLEDSKDCEHVFMPLDSSEEYFACKYCGLIVPKSRLKQ